jgi:hypothetical protein
MGAAAQEQQDSDRKQPNDTGTLLFDGIQFFFCKSSRTSVIFSFSRFSWGCFKERAFS